MAIITDLVSISMCKKCCLSYSCPVLKDLTAQKKKSWLSVILVYMSFDFITPAILSAPLMMVHFMKTQRWENLRTCLSSNILRVQWACLPIDICSTLHWAKGQSGEFNEKLKKIVVHMFKNQLFTSFNHVNIQRQTDLLFLSEVIIWSTLESRKDWGHLATGWVNQNPASLR